MSKITTCRTCGGNIVEPAYPGDGAYPVPPMCQCDEPRTAAVDCAALERAWREFSGETE